MPRAVRHLARVGLARPSHSLAVAGDNYPRTFCGERYEIYRLAMTRAAARQKSDPLAIGIWARVRPSPLVLAASLLDALQRMHEDGDKVAEALLNAANDGRLCNPSLPGNHYAWRDRAGQVSYTPAGRELRVTDDGRWGREGRQETTPARFARQVLRDTTLRRLGDAALSAFAVRFRAAEQAETLTFEEWTGAEDINRAYDEVRGTGSCMEGDPVGDFYARAGASVFVAIRNGSPVARAILWEDDDGRKYMDRVYAARDEDQSAVLDEAPRRGWWRKERQSNSGCRFISPSGETIDHVSVTAPRWPINARYVPYLDTLQYYNEDERTLSTHDDGATHQCRNTDGTADNLGGILLDDGRRIDEDDAVRDVDGYWQHRDEVYEVDGEYYPEGDDRVTYCDHNHQYILSEYARRVTIGRETYTVHEDQISEL